MSITRLEEYQEADEAKKLLQTQTMKFPVQELLLTNVGDDGACNEIHARFQLQDSLWLHSPFACVYLAIPGDVRGTRGLALRYRWRR